uniref:Uncharacterized protein n=1 Tax=Timema cristinae TaxID=61476 RepID=A0A7R9H2R3_TIMCR|nr:unnamed protein product [Timema cristinae]
MRVIRVEMGDGKLSIIYIWKYLHWKKD